MQTAGTFLDAGWDFVDETANGTEDIWWIDEGQDYPRLWWEPYKYGGGAGTAEDPYQIWTAEQMNAIGADPYDWGKDFRLMADIDLVQYRGTDLNLIGTEDTPFSGVFDGRDHAISNLSCHFADRRDNVGLFRVVRQVPLGDEQSGVISNLRLVDPNVSAPGSQSVGALAGDVISGRVVNCGVERGAISGLTWVGGLVGHLEYYGIVEQCAANGAVAADTGTGGLVGQNVGMIVNCRATAAVSGASSVGGLAGINKAGRTGTGMIVNCYATGRVEGGENTGGLAGRLGGDISQCLWDMETSGQTANGAGEGKTTAEMKTAATFLDAGWDFVDETANGTEDVWSILDGQDYPRLWWEAEE